SKTVVRGVLSQHSAGNAKMALWQFRRMIICMIPSSWPMLEYADYGCYCGKGGTGTPVDDLDRQRVYLTSWKTSTK
uniref:Phospholipase A2 n=1 Tax=Paramormyrops kingsleyae TaxID=1676925 RepID=A0A3B3QX51_9TELE